MRNARFDNGVTFLGKRPRVLVSPKIMKEIRAIVALVPFEVSWLGTVDRIAEYEFRITELFLVEQKGNDFRSTLLAKGQHDLMAKLISEGASGLDKIERLRFWAHSHADSPVYASSIDLETFHSLISDGRPYQLMGIFNRRGDMLCEVFIASLGIVIHDVAIEIEIEALGSEEMIELRREVMTLVSHVPFQPSVNRSQQLGGNHAS